MAVLCRASRSRSVIRVEPRPEYPDFDAEVRKPGYAFLGQNPNPTSEQFRKKNYWSRALPELHAAYAGICAYTCAYLPDNGSVDHFVPKASSPARAYEWDNFRLCSGRVNSTKGNSAEVLDPFVIQDGWFTLDIPSCLIKPNPDLPHDVRAGVRGTVNALRLNSDDLYVQERCAILVALAEEHISLDFVRRRYPFLAKEVERQGLTDQLGEMFGLE
jgi:5-methylcytosine-specific restriction endonuclease McrA